jgi:hydrogenase maturation protein HypF
MPGEKDLAESESAWIVDPAPMLHRLIADIQAHTPKPILSARFHNGVAEMVKNVAIALREDTGISRVALSGGVWQNTQLLTKTVVLLHKEKFSILLHRQVPPNDGGIALGQAVICHFQMGERTNL